jgi:hypothetical protein
MVIKFFILILCFVFLVFCLKIIDTFTSSGQCTGPKTHNCTSISNMLECNTPCTWSSVKKHNYSDDECEQLKERGFDVVCTYTKGNNTDNRPYIDLDRALNTKTKRYGKVNNLV